MLHLYSIVWKGSILNSKGSCTWIHWNHRIDHWRRIFFSQRCFLAPLACLRYFPEHWVLPLHQFLLYDFLLTLVKYLGIHMSTECLFPVTANLSFLLHKFPKLCKYGICQIFWESWAEQWVSLYRNRQFVIFSFYGGQSVLHADVHSGLSIV